MDEKRPCGIDCQQTAQLEDLLRKARAEEVKFFLLGYYDEAMGTHVLSGAAGPVRRTDVLGLASLIDTAVRQRCVDWRVEPSRPVS